MRKIIIAEFAKFEKEIYENPHQDYQKLICKIDSDLNLKRSIPNWFFDHLVPKLGMSAAYFKAMILSDKLYDSFSNVLGGKLSENLKTAKVLRKNIFRYGKFMNDNRLNKNLARLD